MKLNEILQENWNSEDYDYPDLEDRGAPSFGRVLNYIKNMTEHEKNRISYQLHDYLDGEYGNYHFWDDNDTKAVMNAFAWLKKVRYRITDEVANRVKAQLRKLKQDGVIADKELIRDKRGI